MLRETTFHTTLLRQRYVTQDDFLLQHAKFGQQYCNFLNCNMSPQRNVALKVTLCAMQSCRVTSSISELYIASERFY